jgi:hypothetical protein
MKNCIKNMNAPSEAATAPESTKKRTTINLSRDILNKGLARQRELRRGSFSNYVEFLVAKDCEIFVPASPAEVKGTLA